jgi:L-aminopeptidase/D-esterase-like protein
MNTPRLPDGFRLGHWTDTHALTGCSVILCPPDTVGSCDVRGSSPGSRELALLAPDKTMQQVNALFLTGGSAFGLAVGDGVMRYLEEHGIGYQTPWIKVPIVPGAVVFDLNIGSAIVRPTAASGYEACVNASVERPAEGNVGAGTGATVGKWGGGAGRMKGGFGAATIVQGDLIVTAVAVVNALGDVIDDDGKIIAGARMPDGSWLATHNRFGTPEIQSPLFSNTTLVAILTNATLSKVEANRLAQRGHDGMARAVRPAHTSFDGDVVFALASGPEKARIDLVAEMGADAAAVAIRSGVLNAMSVEGVPACH